jgi:hypothetical protein
VDTTVNYSEVYTRHALADTQLFNETDVGFACMKALHLYAQSSANI